jgi:chemotaxis protein methyltransferase CheR
MAMTELQRFATLITQRTGLCVPERDWPRLGRIIGQRLFTPGNGNANQYFQRLADQSDAAGEPWRDLVRDLTVGESYFFRDQGQMALLREQLLPDLIARNGASRCLRLWSAGCSTGEEPLTLAMLLDELLPQRAGWNVTILGTDLNPAAIEKGRTGVFGSWSFRGVPPEIRSRYFRPCGSEWTADSRLLSQLTLREGNLLADPFPNRADGLHDFDLILCRNVFIYFDAGTTQTILEKFSATLREGGYLMTGHAETHGMHVKNLGRRHLPGSLVYQRDSQAAVKTPAIEASTVAPPRPAVSSRPLPQAAAPARDSAAPAAPVVPAAPAAPGAVDLFRSAQTFANLGRYKEAMALCHRAYEADPLFAPAHFLAAQLAEQRGELDEACTRFKRVIYLVPDFAPAYVELASLYAAQGDDARATRMRATAGELLGKLPPETVIEMFAPLTAGELVQHLREMTSATEALP